MDKHSVKILLVDDEVEVTAVLAKRLGKRGYICDSAFNGAECLKKIPVFNPAIIVMDVKMPVMDGLETLSQIVATYKSCKTVLLSGHADMKMAVNAMSHGAFAYLMKPVDFDELLFKIEDAVRELELEN